MVTFLQIVLAVILVIAALIAGIFFWLKRKLTRTIGDYATANSILGGMDFMPARISLRRGESCGYSAEFQQLADAIQKAGFQRIADLEDHGGAYQEVLATGHRELPVAAAVTQDFSDNVSFVMFAMNREREVVGRGNDETAAVSAGKVDWQMDRSATPETALAQLQPLLSERSVRFDLKLFRAVFEQVYALRMDQKIVHEPTIESVRELAGKADKEVTDDQISAAHEMLVENWKTQIEEAVLDRYRRASKIDAVAWEELEQDVQIIHNRLIESDIADRVILDDVSEKLFEQCAAQGLRGIELYDAVNDKLPPDQQMKKLAAIDRPVKAVLYVPNEDIQSDIPTTRRYVYEAQDEDGNDVQGSVLASGSGDAKRQLAELGLPNAKLLIEPAPPSGNDDFDELLLDDRSAEIAAKSTKEGIFASLMRAIVANWWIWAPPTGLVMKSFYDGAPFGWGDYAGFVYAAIALLALIFIIGPMFFYNQLLVAQLKARPGRARFWIALLSVTGRFAGLTSNQLTIERCKSMAEEGKLGDALEMIADIHAEMTEEEYQAGLISIYSAAGDWSAMMDAQRAYLSETPAKETATVDLALSVARYSDDVESAEPLIQSIRPSDLPEVALIGYQYVRGLLAAHRGQNQQALKHYAQAIETARQFESLPIMIGMIAEINGHAALAYKRSGDSASASKLWKQNLPIIEPHRSSERLIETYESEERDEG